MSQPDDFVREFLTESREGLDQLDSDLVALESNPEDTDRFDSAFRVLHTIKGNAGFLDFVKLGALAHAGETLLSALRSGDRALDGAAVDILLRLLDTVRGILNSIESNGSEGDDSFDELSDTLRRMAAGESVITPPSSDAEARSSQQDDTERDSKLSAQLGEDSDPSAATITFAREELDVPAESEFDTDSGAKQKAKTAAEETTVRAKKKTGRKKKAVAPPSKEKSEKPVTVDSVKEPPVASAARPEAEKKSGDSGADQDSAASDSSDARQDSSQAVKTAGTGSAASSLVRVDVDLLDRLMNLVGELVLARNQIVQLASQRTDPELQNPIQRLNLLTTELQEGVLKTRMQQIGSIWQRYPRMVRDFAKMCGKEVELQLAGEETELDKSLVESIADPLVHLIRNAIDHGIEKPYLRKVKKKPRTGLLTLRASHEGGQVLIEITDDGSGLDLSRIRKKAIERGLFSESDADQLDERDLRDSIFMPGFSTADQISNVSGRGVGMDVVKTHIERVGGTIEIDTEKDVGTTFRLTVPLTLAIIPALIVTNDGQRFAIPQTNVAEMLTLQQDSNQSIESFHDTPVLRLRGDIIPVVSLSEQLQIGCRSDYADGTCVMVLKTGTRQFALIVDAIGNSEEIVVKPFGQVLDGMSEYGGATIMGDGSVALILDIRGIAQRAGLFATDRSLLQSAAQVSSENKDVVVEDSLLVADLADRRRVALPLRDVIRLEEIPAFRIEISEGREVVQYRGDILPLIRVEDVIGGLAESSDDVTQPEVHSVVIYRSSGRTVGLIVRRVIDIAEEPERIRPADEPGLVVGTLVSLGSVTDLIDVDRLIEKAGLSTSVT